VEVCVNGIGERAGNASLEEVALAIKTRKDFFGLETNINTREIYRTSRLVTDLSGMSVQPNKAIVGANAFRHQSGIHQDGILKMRETYEIMDARDLGWPTGGAEIVLGKTSGRHGFKARLEALGYELTEEELNRAFLAFKELADKKQEVDDRDLEALVADKMRTSEEIYHLDFVRVSCGDHASPTATVRLIAPDGALLADAAAFLDAPGAPTAGLATLFPVAGVGSPRLFVKRDTCCLLYRLPEAPDKCLSCRMIGDEERRRRITLRLVARS
jgi:2-isopropylmalate synthase